MVGAVIVGDAGADAAAAAAPGAGTAPAAAEAATGDQTGPAAIAPAALGGTAAGGIIGLVAGLLVARRRSTATSTDSVRTSPALDA